MMRIIDTANLKPDTPLTRMEREYIYNGLDCCVTLEILNVLTNQLDNTSAGTYNFSRELQAPILEMTMRGVLIDQERRAEVLKLTVETIARVESQLDRLFKEGIGVDANWRSSKQLCNIFYDVMGLPLQRKRNANGQFVPTVERDAIEKLEQYFLAEPFCAHLIALRELDKKRQFLETGIDNDGRMRTNFNIAGTNTGRLASAMSDFGSGGNLQNVDRSLREVFIADPGMKFANLDLEQGDARNVGAVIWNQFVESHGEQFAGTYLAAAESGDLHTTVCRMAWTNLHWTYDPSANRKVAEVLAYRQDSYRQLAKKLGHGTNFYGRPTTMAKHTKVDKILIDNFQKRYFAGFPAIGSYNKDDHKIDTWHNRIRAQLRDTSSLTTLLGRRRFFYGRWFDDETLRGAIAFEPQSLTADEIDTGLLRLWRANRVQLLLQVHDSILLQYPEEQEDEILPWAVELMKVQIPLKNGRDFHVPVEAKVGWNWGELQRWTEEDFKEKKCTAEQMGTVKANPDGLTKWQGHDNRRRTKMAQKLSLHRLL